MSKLTVTLSKLGVGGIQDSRVFTTKTQTKMIANNEQHAKHSFSGQNTQHLQLYSQSKTRNPVALTS